MALTLRIPTGPETRGRIDAFLVGAAAAEGYCWSRSFIKRLLESGSVLVSGVPVKPSYLAKPGDDVSIVVPEPSPSDILPEDIPLDVIFEDQYIIIINKPQGMVVHPAPGHFSGTLVNALMWRCGGALSGINGVLRPGIVHRLDRDTSGILAVAKTDAAHRALAAQLAARTVERRYLALAIGRLDEPVTVNQPIARHRIDRKKMAVDPAGREAITHITPISGFTHPVACTYLEARLETGRTHQIRVHLAHLHRPVAGDTVYGPETQPFKLPGQALHAAVLGFDQPISGEKKTFSAPLPSHFQRLLELLS